MIKGDPAFVGRLIKAANGLVAENRRAIVSVQEALMVLGLPAVRTLALGFSLLSTYRKGTCQGFDYPALLVLRVADGDLDAGAHPARARGRARRGLQPRPARAGRRALARDPLLRGLLRLLAELKRDPGLQQVVLEDQAFAMNHRELGAAMLADWGVPDALVQPVRFHEQPELAGYGEESREAGIVQCLVLARAVAQLCLAPEAEHVRLMAPMLRLAGRLGLGRGEFVSLCERVGRDWAEWGKLLQIRTEDAPRFAETGQRRLPEARRRAGSRSPPRPSPPAMRALVLRQRADRIASCCAAARGRGLRGLRRPRGRHWHALEAALDVQPQLLVADWSDEGERVVRAPARRSASARGAST